MHNCLYNQDEVENRRHQLQIPDQIPHNFPYAIDELKGTCENVVGYIPIPLGVAGPLPIDGKEYYIPLATTEGALIASINRGCKLIRTNGEVKTVQVDDGMTRGPVIQFANITSAHEFYCWISSEEGFVVLKTAFDSTSKYGKLIDVKLKQAGRLVYVRLKATTGDAMGMNILGKGTEAAMRAALERFSAGQMISLSGNYCTDKKASALNWIEGRGKAVVAEAILSKKSIKDILHCSSDALLSVHQKKCMIGSSIAGCIGGNNAHAANIVAAIFVATGQDVAQVVDSSSCLTLLEDYDHDHIHASVTMPCIQVGCIGGGTVLVPQYAALNMLKGAEGDVSRVARNIAASALAGELSLLGSLAEGSLMKAHLKLNRK